MTIPSPRDWTEDAAHENGSYVCRCVHCHETFVGYKRRVCCKVCHDADSAEAKRRAEWLHAHQAPSNWTIFTIEEVRSMRAEYADLLLRLHVEQKMRRELTEALDKLSDAEGYLCHGTEPDIIERARKLDEPPVQA